MINKKLVLLAALSISFAISAFAQDPAPREVSDLIGARAAGGETQLQNRGYRFIKSEKGADRIWANWWKSSSRTCLSVVTMNGRFDSIVTAPPFDCNQNAGGGNNNNGGNWGGQMGSVPSWAIGTFYGRNPQNGGTITLTINRNGSVNINFGGTSGGSATIYKDQMNNGGIISRITRLSNGIRTTRLDNGERIDYYTNNPGGGWNGGNNNNNGNQMGNVSSWAIGTFYGRNPQNGSLITLEILRTGSVNIRFEGGSTEYATIYRDVMNHNGVVSRISRLSNGISTIRNDNGERLDYYKTRPGGGGWNGGNNGGGWNGGNGVNVSDLVGIRASSGESEMETRGFRSVDGFKSGTTSYTIWWRAQSRQCIQVATADGKYDSLTTLTSHPKCR